MPHVLGFDFGMKRIGVALGNTFLQTARPLDTLDAKQGIPNWSNISLLIKTWQAQAIIVGRPTHIDGSEQFTTHAAVKFANRLKERYKLPVFLIDERLTTKEARQQLFDEGGYRRLQKAAIDSYAAKLITEQWLIEQEAFK